MRKGNSWADHTSVPSLCVRVECIQSKFDLRPKLSFLERHRQVNFMCLLKHKSGISVRIRPESAMNDTTWRHLESWGQLFSTHMENAWSPASSHLDSSPNFQSQALWSHCQRLRLLLRTWWFVRTTELENIV